MITRMASDRRILDAISTCGLLPHQLEAAKVLVENRLAILGGGPGTGKTYTTAMLVAALRKTIGSEHVCIGCPTGKAAVRVRQALLAVEINDISVGTWHSLLMPRGGSMTTFEHNASNPLPYRWVIGDESSMIDCGLMASILEASRFSTVTLVGDVNQLAPVGHGAPLRDLIAAGVPYAELTKIHRNSGRIVEACRAIRKNEIWNPSQSINLEVGENLELHHRTNPAQQIETVVKEIHAAGQRGLDKVWDCQVVVPLNKKGEVSRRELNRVLQRELNHNNPVAGTQFRIGDKVINTKSCRIAEITPDDKIGWKRTGFDVHVANGEQGRVIEITPTHIYVDLIDTQKTVATFRGKDTAKEDDDSENEAVDSNEDNDSNSSCTFELGYAVSCHKAQGSEWPFVVVVLDSFGGAKRICDRSWIYTAISRAKQHCALVGTMATARDMCRRNKIQERKTFLAEIVKEKLGNGN